MNVEPVNITLLWARAVPVPFVISWWVKAYRVVVSEPFPMVRNVRYRCVRKRAVGHKTDVPCQPFANGGI